MRWIVATSLRFRFLVVFCAAVLMLVGITRVRNMPVDVFPEFAPPLVEIQTEGPGMSSHEVEDLITIQLEQAFNGTPGLDVMRSKSVPGLSSIVLMFKPGTDALPVRQLVQERLQLALPRLPSSAGLTVMRPPLSATSRVMKIGMTSKTHSLMDLSMIAYWTLRFRLMQVPGVANVAIWGERIRALYVNVNPQRLRAHGVSLDEAREVASDALELGLLKYTPAAKMRTGGFIDTPNQRLGIRHVLPEMGPEALARVAVHDRKKPDGTPLRLGDVADVVWDTWPLIGDAVINDGPGLLLVVEKFPWANTLDVSRGVEKALATFRPGLPGIDFDTTIFRPATFIEMALDNLTRSLLLGSLLVALVLFAFLWDWRSATISLVIIPVSLIAALLVLNARGATINVMVLAGLVIAIGAVIDAAIVSVENIVRRLRQRRGEGSSIATIVIDASLEVRGAIVTASLIEISALLPVFFLQGVTGAFFQPLALSYALAVLASTGVALTLTPALSLIVLSHAPLEHREPPLMRWLYRGYDRMLAPTIRTPRPVFIATGGIVLAGLAVLPFLGQSLFPVFKETDFLMHWVTTPGTSHPEITRMTTLASRELRAIPGVRNFGSHIGRAVLAEEVTGVNAAENWISIDPSVNYNATVAAIQKMVDGYPGLFHDVQTYLKERIKEVLTGSSDSIVVRIYGPALEGLRSKAEEVRQALSGIPGLVELHTDFQVDVPHVQVKVDLAKAQRHGLKPGDIRRAAATLMAGNEVSDIHLNDKVYDVWVWSTPETRRNLTNIREMLIDTPGGGHVRLEDVAAVNILPTPNMITRENQSRFISVAGNVRGRDLGAVARDVERAIGRVKFPLEYHAEVQGEYEARQAAQERMLVFSVAAAIVILFFLQTTFGSWRLATLSFMTLPAALVGGVLAAFFASGGVISLGTLVGFLTVLGIVARNGIMLITHYQHLEQQEGEAFGPGLVLRGARERLRPILMTMSATGLALVPLVVAGDISGHEIEYPMAIVILGGLATSTLLNLFVVPSLYLRFGRTRNGLSHSGASDPHPA